MAKEKLTLKIESLKLSEQASNQLKMSGIDQLEDFNTFSLKELNTNKIKIIVDVDPVATSFEKWAQPGHFSRTLAKGP
ncbi:MAG: hypothetical protein ACPF9F_00915, partial [Acholeplasmataceae bacterium]